MKSKHANLNHFPFNLSNSNDTKQANEATATSNYLNSNLNTNESSFTSSNPNKKILKKIQSLNPSLGRTNANNRNPLRWDIIKETIKNYQSPQSPQSPQSQNSSKRCIKTSITYRPSMPNIAPGLDKSKETSTKRLIPQETRPISASSRSKITSPNNFGLIPSVNDLHKKLKIYMETSNVNISDEELKRKLHILKERKQRKVVTSFNQWSNKLKINKTKRRLNLDEQDPNYEKFLHTINNPCLGIEGIKLKFGKFLKNHNMKYQGNFHDNYNTKTWASTMIAWRWNKNSNLNFDLSKKKKLTQASRLKWKCKTINWFIDNHKDWLARWMDPKIQEQILQLCQKKSREFDIGLNTEEFATLLKNNKITKDPELIQKLFWILDEDGNNDLNWSEIASGIEMLRNTTPEEKVGVWFRWCDEDNSNTVSKQEFYNWLKRNIINKDDIPILKKSINLWFSQYGVDAELTLEQLQEGFRTNKKLQMIINQNMVALKAIDGNIDEDIRKNWFKLNAEQDNYIRQLLMGGNGMTCPPMELKFEKMMNGYINTKSALWENNKKNDKDNDTIAEEVEEEKKPLKEEEIFKEEKEFWERLLNTKKKNSYHKG